MVLLAGLAPLAARPARQLLIAVFAVKLFVVEALQGKAFCFRKTALLAQSKVCFELGQRKRQQMRLLISSLQDIINVLFYGQLVPQVRPYNR